jgi:hypothetical protein
MVSQVPTCSSISILHSIACCHSGQSEQDHTSETDYGLPFALWVAAAIIMSISTWNAISAELGSLGAVTNNSLAESSACCENMAFHVCICKVFGINISMGADCPACDYLAIYMDHRSSSGRASSISFSLHGTGSSYCGGSIASKGVIGDRMMWSLSATCSGASASLFGISGIRSASGIQVFGYSV